MTYTSTVRVAIAASAVLSASTTATRAHAQMIDCNDPSLKSPVYVYGSSAVKPLVAALGASLFSQGITMVYIDKGGSCDGVNAIVSGITASGVGLYYPGGADDGGVPKVANCNVPVSEGGAGGQAIDLGVSDVWPESCPNVTVDYAKVGNFNGPNQVMTFVVPQKAAAMYKNISAEAAYFVMGQAAGAKTVPPWTDDQRLVIRSGSSGTQTMLGKAIRLEATLWKGKNAGSSGGVETALQAANDNDPNPERFLGILSTGEADRDRRFLTVLGFQDFGKKCAIWPDSTLNSFDKANVRTGLYPIWGPLHLLARVSAKDADPVNPVVAKIIHYFLGIEDPPGGRTQLLDLEIDNHTVPQCAMTKQRTTEMGPLSDYKPAAPCGCYFEARATGSVPVTCVKCTGAADCGDAGDKVCSYGYCEAK